MDNFLNDKFYRFVFENSMDAILITQHKGKILKANSAACSMFQMTENEICEAGRYGLVDKTDPNLAIAAVERMQTGKVRATLTFLRKDGTRFIGDMTSALSSDDQGNVWTVMIIRDITKNKEAEEELQRINNDNEYYANYDYLTKIMNRRAFINLLGREIEKGRDLKSFQIGLILLDIDYFKNINDQYGHIFGDQILTKVADILAANLRPQDILGRYGGDEFIICLPDTNLDQADEIAERLRSKIEMMEIQDDKSLVIKLTASFGVTGLDNLSLYNDLDTLISKADNFMYQAKIKRNSVCYGI